MNVLPATPLNVAFLANTDKKITSTTTVLDNTLASVSTCTTCSQLSALKSSSDEISAEFDKTKAMVTGFFDDQVAEITKTINGLAPLLAAPTDIGSCVSWITKMIANIQGPYTKMLTVQAQMLLKQTEFASKLSTITGKVNSLQSSITAKSSTLNCTI